MTKKWTKADSKRMYDDLYGEVVKHGHQPPFTITVASEKGTVHTFNVAADGQARHTVTQVPPHMLPDDLRAGQMVVHIQA